jgi:hypothetical protein
VTSRTFLLTFLAAVAVAACGDRGESPSPIIADEMAPAAAPADMALASRSAAGGMAANFASNDQGRPQARGGPRALGDTASLPTMLIRTGHAEVRVDSLEPAISALGALAYRTGGYVGNTNYMGGEERRRQATIQLRIPSAKFRDVQEGLTAIGEVRSLNIQVQDVGEEYTDAAARVRSKRQVEARLLELLRTRTGRLSDVVELEMALENVRNEIETTEGRLRYLRNQVGLSTMTVTLSEPGLNIAEPGHHPIRDAFGAAWRNFTGFVAGIIAASGWLIPLGLLVWVGVWLARTAWRRRTA